MHEAAGTSGDAGTGRAAAPRPSASRPRSTTDTGIAILDTVRALAAQPDRDGVCRVLAEALVVVAGADGATVRLHAVDGLRPRAAVGLPDDVEQSVVAAAAIDELLTGHGASGEPIVAFLPPHAGRPGAEDASRTGRAAATLLVLPIAAGGEVIGVAMAVRYTRRRFSPHSVAIATALARHASAIIHQLDLVADARAWDSSLEAVRSASARMSRQSTVEDVGRVVVEELRRVVDYHNCRVYLREETDELLPIAFEGRAGPFEIVDPELLRTRVGSGLTGWVAAHDEAVLLANAREDPRAVQFAGTAPVDESALVVPIRYDERAIGVITLSMPGVGRFGERDLRLVSILADQAAVAIENARLLVSRDRLTADLRGMLELTTELVATLDRRSTADTIARHLCRASGADECAVSDYEAASGTLVFWGNHPPRPVDEYGDPIPLSAYPATQEVLDRQSPHVVAADDPDADRAELAVLGEEHYGQVLMIPLVANGASVGLAELYTRGRVTFSAELLDAVRAMANAAAVGWDAARMFEQARTLAERDPLTGFLNHRVFRERLGEEIVRARRTGAALAVLMADLDDFKLVNDTFGHLLGDDVLRWAASRIRSTLRASDLPARYGGDEFAVILPEADATAGRNAADRILAAFHDHPFQRPSGGGLAVGLAIGVGSFPRDGVTATEIVDAADQRMLALKRERAARLGARAAGRG